MTSSFLLLFDVNQSGDEVNIAHIVKDSGIALQ